MEAKNYKKYTKPIKKIKKDHGLMAHWLCVYPVSTTEQNEHTKMFSYYCKYFWTNYLIIICNQKIENEKAILSLLYLPYKDRLCTYLSKFYISVYKTHCISYTSITYITVMY